MENSFNNYRIIPQFSDVMSRKECDIKISMYFKHRDLAVSLFHPLIPANMDTISGEKMYDYCANNNYLGLTHRYQDLKNTHMRYAVSVGSVHNEEEKITLAAQKAKFICVDLAHGHSAHMKDTLEYLRKKLNYKYIIIAGNVVTHKAVTDLCNWGANIIKVGIGQGYVCETTNKTGVGLPQMHALLDCVQGKLNLYDAINIPIIADGGIRHAADFCKAMAIPNVIAVMAGSIFAGTDMTPTWQGEGKPCIYRGMASKEARESVGISDYIEGRSVDIVGKPIGSTESIFNDYKHALQSAMSYVGARNITEYKQKATLQCIKD